MRSRIHGWRFELLVAVTITASIAITVTACGSDDDSKPSSRSSAVDKVVASAREQDIEVDESCVSTVVGQFSEADFAVLDENATDPDVDALTPEGQGLVVQLINCTGGRPGGTIPPAGGLTTAQNLILEQIRAGFDSQGLTYDDDCLVTVITSSDATPLANDEFATDLVLQAQACITQ